MKITIMIHATDEWKLFGINEKPLHHPPTWTEEEDNVKDYLDEEDEYNDQFEKMIPGVYECDYYPPTEGTDHEYGHSSRFENLKLLWKPENIGVPSKNMYYIQCVECKEKLDITGDGGFSVFDTPEKALEDAENCDWLIVGKPEDAGFCTVCLCCVENEIYKSEGTGNPDGEDPFTWLERNPPPQWGKK
jgi:hypothetical protein